MTGSSDASDASWLFFAYFACDSYCIVRYQIPMLSLVSVNKLWLKVKLYFGMEISFTIKTLEYQKSIMTVLSLMSTFYINLKYVSQVMNSISRQLYVWIYQICYLKMLEWDLSLMTVSTTMNFIMMIYRLCTSQPLLFTYFYDWWPVVVILFFQLTIIMFPFQCYL